MSRKSEQKTLLGKKYVFYKLLTNQIFCRYTLFINLLLAWREAALLRGGLN